MTQPAAPPTPQNAWGTLWRLLTYVGRHRGLVAMSLVLMVVHAGVDVLVPEVVKQTVDGPIGAAVSALRAQLPPPDGVGRDLLLWSGALLGVVLVASLIRAWRMVISVRTGRIIGMSLRLDVFRHIQEMGLKFFNRNPVGVLTTRVTGDIESIEDFFQSGVAAVFHESLKLVLILVILFVVNAKLALVVLSVVPFLVLVAWGFTRRSRRDFGAVRAEVAATNAFTTEAIGGVEVTRLFQRENRAIDRYAGHTDKLCDAHLATVRNFAFFFPAVDLLGSVAVALVLLVGGKGIIDGTFTYGEFFQFYLLIDRFFEPIRNLSENLNVTLQAMVSAERVFKVADAVPSIRDPEKDPVEPERLEGRVTFEDVHFAYLANEPVLRGIGFDLEPGRTLALVGPTGAGKTSILSLVSRFYDVDRGRVLVDGVDVRDYGVRALRRRIAVVLQDVFLFHGTVLDNIRLFDPSISRERVEDAVRAVRAERVIERLPHGLDSPVLERGANFSVGERQLLAFARALVHDPDVLVLDEATSSIDTESELLIQQALDTLREGRTTLVVAHRLSTIRKADTILVLRKGVIEERGSHAELLQKDGLYRRLYELQVREASDS